jgi:hypothetical protein
MVCTTYLYLFMVIWGMLYYCFTHIMGISINGGTPIAGWFTVYHFISWKIHLGCLPHFRKPPHSPYLVVNEWPVNGLSYLNWPNICYQVRFFGWFMGFPGYVPAWIFPFLSVKYCDVVGRCLLLPDLLLLRLGAGPQSTDLQSHIWMFWTINSYPFMIVINTTLWLYSNLPLVFYAIYATFLRPQVMNTFSIQPIVFIIGEKGLINNMLFFKEHTQVWSRAMSKNMLFPST